MKIKLCRDSFVRISDNQTLFWNRRNAACEILDGLGVFASRVSSKWVALEDVFAQIGKMFALSSDEVRSDFQPIVNELLALGLIESDEEYIAHPSEAVLSTNLNFDAEGGVRDDEWTPLGTFFKEHKIPSELHIDLTAACTERCVHCYLPDYPAKFLSIDLAKKALHEFREMQGLTVHLTGGECMMHPSFKEICAYCQDLNLNFLVLSNLTLCDADMISFLRECQPQFINVSLYSMKAEEHDAITTVPGSWRKTMDAILACEAAGVHIRLAAPLLKENRNAFTDLKRFASEHHMLLIPNADIVPQCNHDCSNMDHACSPEELENVIRSEKQLFDRAWGAPRDISDNAPVCDIGISRLYLNSLGNYYPCDSMHGYILGNVATDSLSDVWYGEKLNRLRAIRNADIPTCQQCPHRLFCKVCPAFNFNATGDLFKTIPAKCANAAVVHRVYGGEKQC